MTNCSADIGHATLVRSLESRFDDGLPYLLAASEVGPVLDALRASLQPATPVEAATPREPPTSVEMYSDERLSRQLMDTYDVCGDRIFWMASRRLSDLHDVRVEMTWIETVRSGLQRIVDLKNPMPRAAVREAVAELLSAIPQAFHLAQCAWQPIETAPRDGTEIWLFGPAPEGPRVTIGHWTQEEECRTVIGDCGGECRCPEYDYCEPSWMSADGGFSKEWPCTLWQPLPTPSLPSTPRECGFCGGPLPCLTHSQGLPPLPQDEMENYRLALAWIKGQSTDPEAKEIAATALSSQQRSTTGE